MALLLQLSALAATAHADPQWTLANRSNVYSASYKNPHCHNGENSRSEAVCRAACAANAQCHSYTWWPGPQPGRTCKYVHNCWWRDDTVWVLRDSTNCAGRSGYKGVPDPSPSPPGPSPPPSPPAPAPPAPPGAMNVLFVIFDDLRVMHKPWGFTQPTTPNTNALAQKSLIFDNAYCNQAVCGPSRASLLSGRRPDTTQMWNFKGGFRQTPGAASWNTWPEWFKRHGYYTAGCGKLFHPGDPEDFDPQSWTGNEYGGYYGQDNCPVKKLNGSHGCPVPDSINHTFPDLETLATAKQQLAKAAAEPSKSPFWIGVGFVKPHMPHVFPAKYLGMVPAQADIDVALHQHPPNGTAASIDWYSGKGADGPVAVTDINTPADKDTQQDWRRNYYAAAAFSDAVMGELLAELDVHGFTDNTLVIMTADHGWGLGEHNHWVKYTNWETDARVPLLVHHPKAPHTWGVHTKSLIEHVDHYPTFAELAGVPVLPAANESIEGSSYASLFSPSASPGTRVWTNVHNASFTQYPRCGLKMTDGELDFSGSIRCSSVSKTAFSLMGYSMRTTRWRFTEWALWNGTSLSPIWFPDPATSQYVELYDHQFDTGPIGAKTWDNFENVNEASANPDVVSALSARVRAFYDKVAASRGKPYGH